MSDVRVEDHLHDPMLLYHVIELLLAIAWIKQPLVTLILLLPKNVFYLMYIFLINIQIRFFGSVDGPIVST